MYYSKEPEWTTGEKRTAPRDKAMDRDSMTTANTALNSDEAPQTRENLVYAGRWVRTADES